MLIQVGNAQFGCSFLTCFCLKWLSLGTSFERVPFYLLSPLCFYLGLSTRAPEKKLMACNISKLSKPPMSGLLHLGSLFFSNVHNANFVLQFPVYSSRVAFLMKALWSHHWFLRHSYPNVLADELLLKSSSILTLVHRICFTVLVYEVYSCTMHQIPEKAAQKMNTAFH